MNKLYLLCVSLALSNPCFATDLQADLTCGRKTFSMSGLQNKINFPLAVDPKLLKELEENISLIAQMKNRKSNDSQEESRESDNTNAPIVQLAKSEQQEDLSKDNKSPTNQAKAKDAQEQRKKEFRKKRVMFGKEKQLAQKNKSLSEGRNTNKKSTQPLKQNQQQLAKGKNNSKNSSNNTQSAKTAEPKIATNEHSPKKIPIAKPTPKIPQSKAPQNLAETKKLSPVNPTAKNVPKNNQKDLSIVQATPSEDKLSIEKNKSPSFPIETGKSKQISPKEEPLSPSVDSQTKDLSIVQTAPSKDKSSIEKNKFPSFPIEDATISVEKLHSKKEDVSSVATEQEEDQQSPSKRKGKHFAPSNHKEKSLTQKNQTSKETSSTYDRYISRQNHHSMSEDAEQDTSATGEITNGESNIRYTSESSDQENIDSEQSDSVEISESPSDQSNLKKCLTPFHTMHIGLRHTEARGVGYNDGYTTLEGFGIYNGNTSAMPFVDLRGHVFDNGKFAGNVGLGGRSFFPSFEHVLGYYLYYDVRQDTHGLTAQQLSPGIELLGDRMEYRINGYFPIGDRKSHKYGADFDQFDGHHILLKTKQRRVLTGGDAEVGAHLTQDTKYDVYAGAGPYYFSTSHASAWGVKARLLGRFKEYVSLEATYSYDHLFGNVIQGTVALNLPFGKKIKRKGNDCSSQINLALSRAAFSPYRFEIPVIKRVSRKEKAINPATDDPWFVWFVNNTSSSDGTFESPFPTLVQAQNASRPNDMIYVFPGDGTSKGMNMGITLKDGQTFFGSGISHRIKTTRGKITIPAFSNAAPLITNVGGDIVTLANGNQIAGMTFLATAVNSHAIHGISINGATINSNTIIGNVDYEGIGITGFGTVDIKNNQIINLLDPALSTFAGTSIHVQDGTFMKANISNNFVSGFIDAINFGPATNPSIAQTDATIANNVISNFRNDGIFYFTGMPNSTVRILGNTINNTVGVAGGARAGISVSMNNTPDSGNIIIENNTVTTTTPNANVIGILAEINGGITHMNVDINNNRVTTGSGAGASGINVRTTVPNVTICATVTNNIVTQQTAGNHDIQITTDVPGPTASVINVDDISGNIAKDVLISGHVNFVPQGTCE